MTDARELTIELIRTPSLTPISEALRPQALRALDLVRTFCEPSGASCQRLVFSGGHDTWDYAVDNLLMEWDGDESLGHICFLGHIDVVPPGDLASWRYDPFGAEVHNGFLYGRGATDMKGAVAAFCVAASHFAKTTPHARPKISAILTSDEEWAAINGTRKVLAWMRDHGHGRSPSAFLCGEPSSPAKFGSHIKIGRRGSLCGTLTARGVQGHAAYPALFDNPNRALGLALAALHELSWDDEADGMSATAFQTIAVHSGDMNATAIVPGEAVALWNIRFSPRQAVDNLVAQLRHRLDFPSEWVQNHPDGSKLKTIILAANTQTASMPYYSAASSFTQCVAEAVMRETGVWPILDAAGGTTDARFVAPVFPAAGIVELGLPENGGGDNGGQSSRGGMHQPDEHCRLADLAALERCYGHILTSFGGGL